MFNRLIVIALALAATSTVVAGEFNPVGGRGRAEQPVRRLIVGLHAQVSSRATAAATTAREQALAQEAADTGRIRLLGVRTGLALARSHGIGPDIHVVYLSGSPDGGLLTDALAALRADPAVAYAVPDGRKYAHAIPDDPRYAGTPGVPGQTGQWFLKAPVATGVGTTTAAVNAEAAWDTTKGSANLVIADLDTGVLYDHPDLGKVATGGRFLPGYDFVGADGGSGGVGVVAGKTYLTANDGDGWDPDPSDPGDWLTLADNVTTQLKDCLTDPAVPEDSSWHGTRVAGILGALTNDTLGIAGLTWTGKILPVRVLGKCGGYDSDIIAGMRWAAGLPVPGFSVTNPNPAKVINLSLGSAGACSASYLSAVNAVLAQGATLVMSAGNDGLPVGEPANCPGVIAVTAVRHIGTKVGFANVSGKLGGIAGTVTLAAPGGNCVNPAGQACLFSLDTTTNSGLTIPDPAGYTYTDQINTNIGTSFSSPIVAGITALMYSVNSHLTPALVRARVQSSARAFPSFATDAAGATMPMCHAGASATDKQDFECNCTTASCGAGLADAPGALAEALRPIASIAISSGSNSPGQMVSLSASGSAAADGRTLASYAWSVTAFTSLAAPMLGSMTGASSSLTVPACGSATVQLVVTDDLGKTDAVDAVYGQDPAAGTSCAAPPPPPPSGGGGGGGGAVDPWTLAVGGLLALAGGAIRRRRHPQT